MAVRAEWSWIRTLYLGCEERCYSNGFRAIIQDSPVHPQERSYVYVFREDKKINKHLRRTFTQIYFMDIRYIVIDRRMANRGAGDRLFCQFSK